MGHGASTSNKNTSKLKFTRNSIGNGNVSDFKGGEERKRRPSLLDRLRHDTTGVEIDNDTHDTQNAEDNGEMDVSTRSILVLAVEEFLMLDGTDLRDNVIDIVINSMIPIELSEGEAVITQGEIGTFVYIVERGNLQVTVNGEHIRTLSSGALFGELALLFDARRSATVACLNDCKLWSLDRSAFKIIQRNAVNLAIMQRTRRFQIVPELIVLPSTALARLMASLTPMSYKSGDALYAAGKCSTKIMLIEEGSVSIMVPPALQGLPQG